MAWIYDRATGRFLGRVSGAERHIAANEDDARGVYRGDVADPEAMIMQDGEPVIRPEAGAERLASAQDAARRQMRAAIDAAADRITGIYPRAEKDSWPQKEAAALAIIAGTATDGDTALIGGEAAVTGVAVADLAGRVVANSARFRQAIGALSGLRSITEAAISAAQDVEAVDAAMTGLRIALAQIELKGGAA